MKKDIKQVRDIAKAHKMTDEKRRDFGSYIHREKSNGNTGSAANGDFTYNELDKLAENFMGKH